MVHLMSDGDGSARQGLLFIATSMIMTGAAAALLSVAALLILSLFMNVPFWKGLCIVIVNAVLMGLAFAINAMLRRPR